MRLHRSFKANWYKTCSWVKVLLQALPSKQKQTKEVTSQLLLLDCSLQKVEVSPTGIDMITKMHCSMTDDVSIRSLREVEAESRAITLLHREKPSTSSLFSFHTLHTQLEGSRLVFRMSDLTHFQRPGCLFKAVGGELKNETRRGQTLAG